MIPQLEARLERTRRELKARLQANRARVTAQLATNPLLHRVRRRRRLRRLAFVAVLLLLLLFLRCDGAPGPGVVDVSDGGLPVVLAAAPKKPLPGKRGARPVVPAAAVTRPDYAAPDRDRAAWLEAFRLQVAARSPRLASCFIGADRPGALRWTTQVVRESGTVDSHDFEPVGASVELSRTQRDCLVDALSKPAYRLDAAPGGLPERLSLVLEF